MIFERILYNWMMSYALQHLFCTTDQNFWFIIITVFWSCLLICLGNLSIFFNCNLIMQYDRIVANFVFVAAFFYYFQFLYLCTEIKTGVFTFWYNFGACLWFIHLFNLMFQIFRKCKYLLDQFNLFISHTYCTNHLCFLNFYIHH